MNKTKTKITLTFLFAIFSIILSTNFLMAADNKKNIHSVKAKERMDMVKKMKMVETMGLDESKSEKFLLKFNAFDKRVEENRKQHRELLCKLDDALKNNNTNGLSQLSEQLLNLQNEFNRINSDKTNEFKGMLSEVEFAKYLVFENKFINEVFNCFMNHHYKGTKGKKQHKKNND